MKFISLILFLHICFLIQETRAQITKPTQDVIVAIVDTGVDIEAPEITPILWQNLGESGLDRHGKDKGNNGIDDDQNGFVDDFHGWNFSKHNSSLRDNHGHGTHIAGIIAKRASNEKVKLMILKYFDPSIPQMDTVSASTKALQYAIANGAQIINFSGGGGEPSAEELLALRDAQQKGIIVVAAAGNEKQNTTKNPFYPASYNLENVISVAALDRSQNLVRSSNFGLQVDTAALGYQVNSLLPQRRQGVMTGTSQATAFVTASLINYRIAQGYWADPATLKNLVRLAGQELSQLIGKTNLATALSESSLLALKGEKDLLFGGPLN